MTTDGPAVHREVISATELYAPIEDVTDPLEVAANALAKLHALGLPGLIDQASAPEVSNVVYLDERRNKAGDRKSVTWGDEDETSAGATSAESRTPSSRTAITAESLMHGSDFTLEQRKLMATYIDKVGQAASAIARKWRLDRDELDEAMSDGYIGLIRATMNHDSEKLAHGSASEANYFWESISGAIRRGLRSRYGRVYEPVLNDAGEQVGTKEVTKRVKPSVMYNSAESLDGEVDDETRPWYETLHNADSENPEERLLAIDARRQFMEILKDSSPRDREVLYRRLIMDQTQSDIAKAVGCSQMHVSRIVKRKLAEIDAHLS